MENQSANVVDAYAQRKKENSEYLTLADGESAKILRVMEFKIINKMGYDGKEKETLRMICEVETSQGPRVKFFDNSANKWAEELQKHKVNIGAAFTISRNGLQNKTRYTISNYVSGQPEAK